MPAHRAARRLTLLLPLLLAATLAACSSPVASSTPASTAATSPTASTSPAATSSAGPPSFYPPVAGQPPVTGRPWFLAIGDSVTSGFSIDPSRFRVNSSWALQLQGLLAASGRPWTLYDTACAGERTDTYSTRCPQREGTPFLADTSQHDAALAAITAHRADLRAILVDLGSNDLLASQRRGVALGTEITALRQALTTIVSELRRAAPGVVVVLCNFYDPEANTVPATRAQLDQVNAMVAQVAAAEGARLADFHAAINTVDNAFDPHLCDYVDCAHGDVHPTIAGHARLAAAALAALGRG
jgi:lysophospholipase L1-like esterase